MACSAGQIGIITATTETPVVRHGFRGCCTLVQGQLAATDLTALIATIITTGRRMITLAAIRAVDLVITADSVETDAVASAAFAVEAVVVLAAAVVAAAEVFPAVAAADAETKK